MAAGCGLIALVVLRGMGGLAFQPGQEPKQRVPPGVIPGAPAGSPDQTPDSSNFDYTSLFHELTPDDTTGFTAIFDGKSLAGWDGDTTFWRVENGTIVGESTPQHRVSQNTFLIWRGERLRDFELKVDFRINGTNSGVQVRSEELPAVGKWVLKGYQADIDAANRFTGQIYEERGRGFLAMRGQFTYIPEGGGPKVVGALQSGSDDLLKIIKVNDWNQAHIIARGNMLTEILNGHVTSTLVDDDTKGRASKGLLGLQIHVGEPMKAEFKNIWLKRY
jgi:hypothetical protein